MIVTRTFCMTGSVLSALQPGTALDGVRQRSKVALGDLEGQHGRAEPDVVLGGSNSAVLRTGDISCVT
jgi:hypothetical protein